MLAAPCHYELLSRAGDAVYALVSAMAMLRAHAMARRHAFVVTPCYMTHTACGAFHDTLIFLLHTHTNFHLPRAQG